METILRGEGLLLEVVCCAAVDLLLLEPPTMTCGDGDECECELVRTWKLVWDAVRFRVFLLSSNVDDEGRDMECDGDDELDEGLARAVVGWMPAAGSCGEGGVVRGRPGRQVIRK